MKKLWNKLVQLGISSTDDISLLVRKRHLNRSAILSALTMFLFMVAFFSMQFFLPAIIASAVLILFSLTLFLSKKNNFKAARIIFVLTSNLAVFIYSDRFSHNTGAQLFFFCATASIFAFFDLKERKPFIFCLLLSPSLCAILEIFNYNIFFQNDEMFNQKHTITLYYMAISISLALCGSLLNQFLISSNKTQSQLRLLIQLSKKSQQQAELRNEELLKTQKLLSQNQEAIQEEKEIAVRALKVKSDFLSNISHEIRTPMNVIIGITDLLLDNEINDEKISNLDLIKKSSNNLLVIINDLLDFSKLESGKMTLEQIEFDLKVKINEILETLKLQLQSKGNEAEFIFDESITPFILSDPTRISQVIINLVSNANKFTENGKITIEVSLLGLLGTSVQNLRFRVSDTGIGIKPSAQEDIFSSFTQASTSTTRKYGGTGLGLPICKHIVDIMNGRIWVESEQGKGSDFYFDLPLNTCEHDIKKCLVIEDIDINQMVVNNSLGLLNYTTDFVSSSDKIEQVLKTETYKLILLNGDSFLLDEYVPIIHEHKGTNVPLILYSSNNRRIAKKAKADERITHVLPLPFSPSNLNDVLY